MDFLHRTWAEIDHDALITNYNIIKRSVGSDQKIMSVVKADAYGHGAVEVARTLEMAGTDWLAVSNVEEALQLRDAGIYLPILVLGTTPPQYAARLAQNSITQTVYCAEYAKELSEHAQNQGVTVDVHIKLDTGMHRIGFAADKDSGIEEAALACRLPGLIARGVFTHFASADKDGDADGCYTRRQFALFSDAVAALESKGITFMLRHCCNSAAALLYPEMGLDMVRAGIILYGLMPSGEIKEPDFKPVMSLKATVSMIKSVGAGDDISYGRTYTADRTRLIATVPVGYADGYIRDYTGSRVLINGQAATVVGRVCMDQMMVDITGLDVKVGDIVTLFGPDLPVDELAKKAGTINYECVCLITKRVARVHTMGGKAVKITNLLTLGEDK